MFRSTAILDGAAFIRDSELWMHLDTVRIKVQERSQCRNVRELMNHIRRFKLCSTKSLSPIEFRAMILKFGVMLPQAITDQLFDFFDKKKRKIITPEEFCRFVFYEGTKVEQSGTLNRSSEVNLKHNLPIKAVKDVSHNSAPARANDLSKAIYHICGSNTAILEHCFVHIPKNQGLTMTFEEFRKCLSDRGLGSNLQDCRYLFSHLGGSQANGRYDPISNTMIANNDYANIDILLKHIKEQPAIVMNKNNILLEMSREDAIKHPYEKVAFKLKNAIRQNYKQFLTALETQGPSGFVTLNTLFHILNTVCMTSSIISLTEFRLSLFQVPVNNVQEVNWRHFMHVYGPTIAFQSPNISPPVTYRPSTSSTVDSQKLPTTIHLPTVSVPHIGTGNGGGSVGGGGNNKIEKLFPSLYDSLPLSPVETLRKNRVNCLDTNTSTATTTFSNNNNTSNNKNNNQKDDFDMDAINAEIYRVWSTLFKEFRSRDPMRTGLLTRKSFHNGLLATSNKQGLTENEMHYLGEIYSVSSNPSMVDYSACIKGATMKPSRSPTRCFPPRPSTSSGSSQRSTSLDSYSMTDNSKYVFDGQSSSIIRMNENNDELEEEDEEKIIRNNILEDNNNSDDKQIESNSIIDSQIQDPFSISSNILDNSSILQSNISSLILTSSPMKTNYLTKTTSDQDVFIRVSSQGKNICRKFYYSCYNFWKSFKNECRHNCYTLKKSCILKEKFIAILQKFIERYDIKLSRNELGILYREFRDYDNSMFGDGISTVGQQEEIINFEEIFTICKSYPPPPLS